MTILHQGLQDTEGVSIAIARILPKENELRFIGVGQVFGSIVQPDGSLTPLLSEPGMVGQNLYEAREQCYDWSEDLVVVLHSKGLNSPQDLSVYPRTLFDDASILAGTLYRDYNRACDDVTVMTVKAKSNRGFPT